MKGNHSCNPVEHKKKPRSTLPGALTPTAKNHPKPSDLEKKCDLCRIKAVSTQARNALSQRSFKNRSFFVVHLILYYDRILMRGFLLCTHTNGVSAQNPVPGDALTPPRSEVYHKLLSISTRDQVGKIWFRLASSQKSSASNG